MIQDVLKRMGYPGCTVSPFHRDEDGSCYDVWRVDTPDGIRVLKKAKGDEAQIYRTYFAETKPYVPKLYGCDEINGETYLLMEYIAGHDMRMATRVSVTQVLDGLIAMQTEFWTQTGSAESAYLAGRIIRGNYLGNQVLERAYHAYLDAIDKMPVTLCHDDLLPFNVIISEDRAVMIDWEVGGLLPYPTSLARLIAHCSQDQEAFFFMEEADKIFAVDYYYSQLVQMMGISREEFDRDLGLCLLYEYCEWVYVGNKYPDADQQRPTHYLKMALQQAKTLGF